jgi:hypothetical protein
MRDPEAGLPSEARKRMGLREDKRPSEVVRERPA